MPISVSDLHVKLGQQEILKGVNFTLKQGELIGLIGPNGAGKSTLLKAMAGLLQLSRGSVTINGKPLDQLPSQQRARQIAYLPQNGPAHWNLSVEALVHLGRLPHHSSSGEDHEAVMRALALTELTDLRNRSVDTLSGGERMRALLARALAVEAPILLADEPIAALDPLHQLQTLELLRTRVHSGTTAIVVLHDLTLVSRYCDRLLLLKHGSILADGSAQSILTDRNIAEAYSIMVHRGTHEGVPFIVPWKAL